MKNLKKALLILGLFSMSFVLYYNTVPEALDKKARYEGINLENYVEKYISSIMRLDIRNDKTLAQQSQVSLNLLYETKFNKEINSIVKFVFEQKSTQEQAYYWLLPSVKESFSLMGMEKKRVFYQMINHMISYLDGFQYSQEDIYYSTLEKNGYQMIFTSSNLHGFRSLEAYIYRRVKSGDFKPADLLIWLKKLKVDLKL